MITVTSLSEETRAWAESIGLANTFSNVTGSTNDDAKSAITPPHEWLILADHQNAGRGRGPNVWQDVGGGSVLLSSWVFHPPAAPAAPTGPRVGLALYRALTVAWPGLRWGLKAPNDIYLDQRKVAGLLIEVISSGASRRLIVGLGFNALAHPALPTATDLRSHLGRAPTRAEWRVFTESWFGQLKRMLEHLGEPRLSWVECNHLREALNARAGRAFDVIEVTPGGDLVHANGVVRWIDL